MPKFRTAKGPQEVLDLEVVAKDGKVVYCGSLLVNASTGKISCTQHLEVEPLVDTAGPEPGEAANGLEDAS